MTIAIIIIIICVLVIVVLRSNKKEEKPTQNKSAQIMEHAKNVVAQSNEKGFYWQDFKRRKPEQASAIETLIGRDMSKATDIDAFQIVTTILRWSENAGCPIGELKKRFLKDMGPILEGMEYQQIVEQMKKSRSEEAAHFNVSLDNTISAFMLQWIQEEQQKRNESSALNKILDNLDLNEEEKSRMFSSIQENVDSMGIAPDISGLDREENRLIELAEEGVDFISNNYKRLDKYGRKEALIYCTTCLIDLPTDYENELDMDKKEDRYFLLLHDKVICEKIDDTPGFINSRIEFYNEQKRKLAESPMYTPMFIYNAFYMNQLCEHPEILKEFNESPVELIMMNAVLDDLDKFFASRKRKIQ
ncbi:MAG: hypothetical protein IKW82_07655 [Bacteroidales bacterium]|nr:hypothetical protein [Bacteroidales bacterium]